MSARYSLKQHWKQWTFVFFLAVTLLSCGSEQAVEDAALGGFEGSPADAALVPSVVSFIPNANATNIYTDAVLTVRFNKSISSSTLTVNTDTTCSGNLQLSTDSSFGSCVALSSSVTISGSEVQFRSAAVLSATTVYYVRLTTGIQDTQGNSLQSAYDSSFTTGSTFTPLTNSFGTDCSAGSDTLATVRAAADGTLSPTQSVPNLIVTAVDTLDYFFVQQSGAVGPAIYVRDTARKASDLGVKVGDVICLEISEKDQYNQWMQVETLAAIRKTAAAGSVTAQTVTAAVSNDTYESELVSFSGTLTTKSTSLAGGGYNHVLTYAGGTITLREISGSGKFENLTQGQAIQVSTVMSQFHSTDPNSGYQLYIDNKTGVVAESTSGNFNVSSASATGTNTVTVTFNNTPNSTTATNVANYSINNGLTVTNATLSGITVTLTTSNQTVGQSYTVSVSNVTRNADSAALTSNTAAFTGFTPAASFTTGQIVINEVHVAPSTSAEEFIELYNTTGSPVSLNGATLWYKSSAGTPGQGSTLTGVIPANGYYTLLRTASPGDYTCSGTQQTSGWSNSGLSNTAGAVILTVDGNAPTATSDSNVRDTVQWASNTSNWGEAGTTGPSVSSQRTLSRAPNGVDTNNTSNDILLSAAANGTCGASNWSSDVTAPTVSSTTPANSATGVALSSTISVTFSESMSVSSVSSTNLYLVQGTDCSATAITGTISTSNPNTTFTFPSGTLTAATQYSICIKAAVQDVALNNLAGDVVRSFTTIAPDVTPPTISSTTPANSATGVSTGTTIAVTFSEAMSTGTVTAQTSAGTCSGSVQVSLDNFANCIAMSAAAPSFTSGDTIATFTPASALTVSTTYKIRVTTSVQDVSSNALASQFETATGFTTGTGGTVSISTLNKANHHLLINEINYDTSPNVDASDEFIEIYNTSSSTINLNGGSIWYRTTGGTFSKKVDLPNVDLPAGGYFVAINDNTAGNILAANLTACSSSFNAGNMGLSNTGATIYLVKDANQPTEPGLSDSDVLDQVAYEGGGDAEDTADSGATDQAISRNSSHSDSDHNQNDFSPNGANGTPCAQ
ncbi:MAG: Ig-like domain-containing protein [Leptospiraceae bacterium]|nr:Ig-like domain-containing protein [Leptospiraceae bacterium]